MLSLVIMELDVGGRWGWDGGNPCSSAWWFEGSLSMLHSPTHPHVLRRVCTEWAWSEYGVATE
jgi:hypothetical protein